MKFCHYAGTVAVHGLREKDVTPKKSDLLAGDGFGGVHDDVIALPGVQCRYALTTQPRSNE